MSSIYSIVFSSPSRTANSLIQLKELIANINKMGVEMNFEYSDDLVNTPITLLKTLKAGIPSRHHIEDIPDLPINIKLLKKKVKFIIRSSS